MNKHHLVWGRFVHKGGEFEKFPEYGSTCTDPHLRILIYGSSSTDPRVTPPPIVHYSVIWIEFYLLKSMLTLFGVALFGNLNRIFSRQESANTIRGSTIRAGQNTPQKFFLALRARHFLHFMISAVWTKICQYAPDAKFVFNCGCP